MRDQGMTEQQPQAVVITGIRIPFWSMVGLMVRWSIASIPAFCVLIVIGLGFISLFIALFIGLFHYFAPGALSAFFMGPFRALIPGM